MNATEGTKSDPKMGAHVGIEQGRIVQVKFFDSGETFKALIVGMERGFYLILRTPPLENAGDRIGEEGNIIVRYSFKGTTYGFVCSLMAYIDHPLQLAIFSYPAEIQTINFRSEDRESCFIPATTLLAGKAYRGYISNISTSGCLFMLDLPEEEVFPKILPGQEADMSVHFMGSTGPQILNVCIRSIRKEEREINLGTQFININMNFTNDIKQLIHNIHEFKKIG